MTTIRYSKERLRSNLRMGIFFIALGILLFLLSFITDEWKTITLKPIGIGNFCAGICMLVIYVSENNKQYLTIKNDELTKNSLIPKKINLAKIISVKEVAGDIKLISEKGELVINTQIMEPNSLIELKRIFLKVTNCNK